MPAAASGGVPDPELEHAAMMSMGDQTSIDAWRMWAQWRLARQRITCRCRRAAKPAFVTPREFIEPFDRVVTSTKK
jgi:hypothetical protein